MPKSQRENRSPTVREPTFTLYADGEAVARLSLFWVRPYQVLSVRFVVATSFELLKQKRILEMALLQDKQDLIL
jgi:hypothetical protein